ncbi:MAG: hypothetical protein M3P51_00470 [Chloroflexota bacterium]|nr:hypothetical protein [Chloroflexota bacterium]
MRATRGQDIPLAYYQLQGLVWVAIGIAVLIGSALDYTGLADVGVLFTLPFGTLVILLGALGLLFPVREYYRSRYGLRYPPPHPGMSKVQFALAALGGLLLGGVVMIAALVSVLVEQRLSFVGLLLTTFLFVVYWPKRRLARYWLLPVVLVPTLILLPFFGIGASDDPYSALLPIDRVILLVVGVLLVALGLLDHRRLTRFLTVRQQG